MPLSAVMTLLTAGARCPTRGPGNLFTAAHIGTHATLTTDAIDGYTVIRSTEDTATAENHGAARAETMTVTNGQVYTYSVYGKRGVGQRDLCLLIHNAAFTANAVVVISLVTGSIILAPATTGAWSGASAQITKYARGWWGLSLKFTAATSTGFNAYILGFPANTSALFDGDGVSGFLFWGADVR